MATDRIKEAVLGATFPNAMRHLQQLIMDAESCAKNEGKRSWWSGKDKFEPCFSAFQLTLIECAKSLHEDGIIKDLSDKTEIIEAVHEAMEGMEGAYSSWPKAFQFWRRYYISLSEPSVWDDIRICRPNRGG